MYHCNTDREEWMSVSGDDSCVLFLVEEIETIFADFHEDGTNI